MEKQDKAPNPTGIVNQRAGKGSNLILLAVVVATFLQQRAQGSSPVGTAFTYQGLLSDLGAPLQTSVDLKFSLWDSASGGAVVGPILTNTSIIPSNGIFTSTLDFGSVFDGSARWLEVAVRTNGSGSDFVAFDARLKLTPSPYSIFATTAGSVVNLASNSVSTAAIPDGAVTLSKINTNGATVGQTISFDGTSIVWSTPQSGGGTITGVTAGTGLTGGGNNGNVTVAIANGGVGASQISAGAVTLAKIDTSGAGAGTFIGYNGTSLRFTNIPASGWGLAGNSGTFAGSNFVGTTDNQALELWVNNSRALRLEPAGTAPNLIGGSSANIVSNGVVGATISGGGSSTLLNRVTDNFGTISGGQTNLAGSSRSQGGFSGLYATIGGGYGNRAGGTGLVQADYATIGGGQLNSAAGGNSTVGGGQSNIASGAWSTVGGGTQNQATNSFSTVAGGQLNLVMSTDSTISGGQQNTVGCVGCDDTSWSTIGGGINNVIGRQYATISGGSGNQTVASWSSIGGGYQNSITSSTADAATVGGGYQNQVTKNYGTVSGGLGNVASQTFATVPGGFSNSAAGLWSFAAGNRAKANHSGTFVWADSTSADFVSTGVNQFLIRAGGNVGINKTNPGTALDVNGTVTATNFIGSGAGLSGITSNSFGLGQLVKSLNGLKDDVAISAGTNVLLATNGSLLVISVNNVSAASWGLSGNSGTATTNFIGTTDTNALELRVNAARALRIEPSSAATANIIGGCAGNLVDVGILGATISGGGATTFLGVSSSNRVSSNFGSVGGGLANVIQSGADDATISGGQSNTVQSTFSTIGGGYGNLAQAGASSSTIGGGYLNSIQGSLINSSTNGTIAGGSHNAIQSNCTNSTIGGGYGNLIQQSTGQSTVAGGYQNLIQSSSSTIAGGYGGTIFAGADNSVIGGGYQNSIGNGGGSTIAGGFLNSISLSSGSGTIGGGVQNTLQANNYSTIAGGEGNDILSGSDQAVICGGWANMIDVTNTHSAIAGGYSNWIQPGSPRSTIAGGYQNTIQSGAYESSISGGWRNSVLTNANDCVVAGGYINTASARYSAVGGGAQNTASGQYSAVGGGNGNTCSGQYAMIPGGSSNLASFASLAAGNRAKAINQGTFVWADSSSFDFSSTNNNSFSVRSVGGARFVSAIDGTGAPIAGVQLAPGGASWSNISDRNAKTNLTPVETHKILALLTTIPISTWSYKSQDDSIRHIGPMAQDFAAAFHVGEDDKHITTVDADGVALAAIQGLNELVKEQTAEIEELRAQNRRMGERLNAIEQRLGSLGRIPKTDLGSK